MNDPIAALVAELSEAERARLTALLVPGAEPIAVVGIGARLPGGVADMAGLARLLADRRDAVREVPRERWDVDAYYDPDPDAPGKMYTRYGAFLDEIDAFDAHFFDVSPREAAHMDPRQRLLLEVAWEALEDAGLPPDRLRRSATGVFIGACGNEHVERQARGASLADVSAHTLTGDLASVLAGRVSYVLGLEGPSLTVDTACSSSLVALHLACQSLRAGQCGAALAGGVNLILGPDGYVKLSRMRALSPDGRCRAFDARANGYARGEGAALLVLKRLDDARKAGDRIWALLLGSAVNHDGRSAGLTAPNGLAQRDVVRAALAAAGVTPAQVGYLEAHGTGTPLGDPIEMESLVDVFGAPRADGSRCAVGSVKSNIGHLEGAAGVAGVLKAIVAISDGAIPVHLHQTQLSPRVHLEGTPLVIPRVPQPWPGRRVAGVSSFGISGTNAHVVVAEPPPPAPSSARPGPHLLTLSARTAVALVELARRTAAVLAAGAVSLGDAAFSANTGRAGHALRLAVIAETAAEATRLLESATGPGLLGGGDPPARISHGPTEYDRRDASSRRSEEGASSPAVTDERRTDAQQIGGQTTEAHELSGLVELARRWLDGAAVDWSAFHREHPGRRVSLPPYPFTRERYAPPVRAGAGDAVLGEPVASPLATRQWQKETRDAVPVAALLARALAAGREALGTHAVALESVTLGPPPRGARTSVVTLAPDGAVAIASAAAQERVTWTQHLGARVAAAEPGAPRPVRLRPGGLDRDGFHAALARAGYHGPRCVERAHVAPGECTAAIDGDPLEAAVQLAVVAAGREGGIPVVTEIHRLARGATGDGPWAGSARAYPGAAGDPTTIDLRVTDAAGRVVVDVVGLKVAWRAEREAAGGLSAAQEGLLYQIAWRPAAPAPLPAGEFAVLGAGPLADALATALGGRAVDALPDGPLAGVIDTRGELRAALALTQALIARRGPRLWLVGNGALWGLGRVLACEQPEVYGGLLDLETPADAASAPGALGLREARVRGGAPEVPRLERAPMPTAGPIALRASATYVVTGGQGALGQAFARWLVARGARHIVLVSRRAAGPEVAELAAAGARVRVVPPGPLPEGPPVAGVIHAAGVSEDAALAAVTWDSVERALAPKLGALALARKELDFFVAFSSVAALVGNPGQAVYAAANAALEARVAEVRAQGVPAWSIAWGPFDVGMAAEARSRWPRLKVPDALAVVERLLAAPPGHVVVAALDQVPPPGVAEPALFAELGAAGPAAPELAARVQAASPEERLALILGTVDAAVRAVLALDAGTTLPPERRLDELGVDSLLGIDLVKALGEAFATTLPSTLVMDHPTVAAIARYLVQELA